MATMPSEQPEDQPGKPSALRWSNAARAEVTSFQPGLYRPLHVVISRRGVLPANSRGDLQKRKIMQVTGREKWAIRRRP